MKHLICHLSLLTLLAAWAAGCQKTDLQETCPQPDVYLLSYSIDASVGCDTLHGRQALAERVQTLVAMTDDGHSIRIWEPDRGQTPHTKEVVTFDTCSREVADQWALEMYLQGYAVEITKIDGIYHCEAVKAAAEDPQTLNSLAGTQWVCHIDTCHTIHWQDRVYSTYYSARQILVFETDSTGHLKIVTDSSCMVNDHRLGYPTQSESSLKYTYESTQCNGIIRLAPYTPSSTPSFMQYDTLSGTLKWQYHTYVRIY